MANTQPQDLLFLFIAGTAFVLLLVVGFFVVLSRSQKRLALEQRKAFLAKEEAQRQLLEAILRAQERERKRLAREMHDELGQVATVQKINLALLKRKLNQALTAEDLDELRSEVDVMIRDADDAIQSVKRIIQDLRPISLEELGLLSEIRNYLERISIRTGLVTEFTSEVNQLVMNEEKAVEVFRIVQEALTNVLRHAEATTVLVTLKMRGDQVILTIKDDGVGIEGKQLNNEKSFGLRGMKERAQLIGGHLAVESSAEGGTVLTLFVPVK